MSQGHRVSTRSQFTLDKGFCSVFCESGPFFTTTKFQINTTLFDIYATMVFFTRKSSHISDCRNNVCCQCKSNEINHYKVRPPKVISCLAKMHTFKNLAYLSIFVMFLFFPFNNQLFFFSFF